MTIEPFHIVLVDLQKAADQELECVEKPLTANLKYVAISYRWGELDESAIHTDVGYTAVIKGFEMEDFYGLCKMMLRDTDIQSIRYVWVDAICINQSNYEKRKATIHQMSNIYTSASYIVAVPDLHKAHLKNTSTMHTTIMAASLQYQKDLYHLIHGNTHQLEHIDNDRLDEYDVPLELRPLLVSATDYFTPGLMTDCKRDIGHNSLDILDHIYHTSTSQTEGSTIHGERPPGKRLHECERVDCPVDLADPDLPLWRRAMAEEYNSLGYVGGWNKLIQERSLALRRSVNLMMDLIKDWSTRVWVISEYSIAKKNNNLKFWFIQLGELDIDDFRFFRFDFNNDYLEMPWYCYNDPVYMMLCRLMATQLTDQTMLEMLLKSRATKNDDRFYAVLPLFPEYKLKMDGWQIDTMASVKLKLFEILTTKDKLDLLFLAGNTAAQHIGMAMPTFASSTIVWDAYQYFVDQPDCNFDLTNPVTLTQHLTIKPKECYVYVDNPDARVWTTMKTSRRQWRQFQPDLQGVFVAIPQYQLNMQGVVTGRDVRGIYDNGIYLIGNMEENIWLLTTPFDSPYDNDRPCWECRSMDNAGFNIY